jgi:hypothetical protein
MRHLEGLLRKGTNDSFLIHSYYWILLMFFIAFYHCHVGGPKSSFLLIVFKN